MYPLDLLLAQFTSRGKKKGPFRCTGQWKLATKGGSCEHFYTRLNASKSARIESNRDRKLKEKEIANEKARLEVEKLKVESFKLDIELKKLAQMKQHNNNNNNNNIF